MDTSKAKRIDLRLPPEMHRQLEAVAKEEARSVNAQIVYLLRQALEAYEAEQAGKLAA
jgi:hypothetical protein